MTIRASVKIFAERISIYPITGYQPINVWAITAESLLRRKTEEIRFIASRRSGQAGKRARDPRCDESNLVSCPRARNRISLPFTGTAVVEVNAHLCGAYLPARNRSLERRLTRERMMDFLNRGSSKRERARLFDRSLALWPSSRNRTGWHLCVINASETFHPDCRDNGFNRISGSNMRTSRVSVHCTGYPVCTR